MQGMEWGWRLSTTGYMGGCHSPHATWHGDGIFSMALENPFEVQAGCGMPVVPVRQFCETPFGDRDGAGNLFSTFECDTLPNFPGASDILPTSLRAYVGARALRGMRMRDDDLHMRDRHYCWICRTYLKMSLLDEADMLFEKVCGGVRQEGGHVKWIDGNSGAGLSGTTTSPWGTAAGFTREGLLHAKDAITKCGFGPEGIVCYTTRKALNDLEKDCASSGAFGSFQRLPVDSMALVDGILMVSSSSRALQIADCDTGMARSVMFVDGVSFGAVSDDVVSVSAKRLPNSMVRFSATHWTGGAIRNADSVCCILHG